MPHTVPHRCLPWLIVFCCSFTNFAFFGFYRSYAVIYVALLQEFNISREDASWPFSLCGSTLQLVGPFASVLSQFTTMRKVCLCGATIASLGIALCFFAQNILWFKICYGVIHGFGMGLVIIWIPITINQHFKENKATAMGLCFAGSTLGGMILPLLFEYLLNEYSLRGAFLITSGITMNVLVAISLIQSAPRSKDNSKNNENTYELVSNRDTSGLYKDQYEISTKTNTKSQKLYSQTNTDELKQTSEDDFLKNREEDYKQNGLLPPVKPKEDIDQVLLYKNENVIVVHSSSKNRSSPREKGKFSEISKDICQVLRTPQFYLFAASTNILYLGMQSFFIVIIDYAQDKGISNSNAIYLLTVFSCTDLFGRSGLGWITDRKYVNPKTMLSLNCIVMAVTTMLFSHVPDFLSFSILSAVQGLVFGSMLTLIYVIQMESFQPKHLIYVLGLSSFVGGLGTFLRPPMVGLFRDTIGSYDWMFYFTGAMYLIVAVIWTIERFVTTRKDAASNIQETPSQI